MNGPTRKTALLNQIADTLRCDVAKVECLRQLPIKTLERLLQVFRTAVNGTKREDRVRDRMK